MHVPKLLMTLLSVLAIVGLLTIYEYAKPFFVDHILRWDFGDITYHRPKHDIDYNKAEWGVPGKPKPKPMLGYDEAEFGASRPKQGTRRPEKAEPDYDKAEYGGKWR
jgi:hypothetical protein